MLHVSPLSPTPIATEARQRRTFAIISHPDAGKTTLTEKLLLFGGAIKLAGHVKARGERRRTRSDWMEIEQARGISVTSSVMTFERDGIVFNLLDTPGHSDFSEDTYRTLSAVDAAIMVIDAAKGIESQTRKLFEVCRLRDIPIVTFINKVDREGLDPLALLDEIASGLALDLVPMTWPIGMGSDFRGCLDIKGKRALLPVAERTSPFGHAVALDRLDDLASRTGIEERIAGPALEEVQIARGALPDFDAQSFNEGHLSPVFFGSALRNFCVSELLDCLARWVPGPSARQTDERTVQPHEETVTGFVFKVQANMDPNHRDRVAFVRLCSGRFRRGMKLFHVRDKRFITVSSPILFFAQERETTDEAYPGDIIGIPNHGTLRVGDTLTEGEVLRFGGIPNFAPELLRRVLIEDPMKAKQLNRALQDLAEEGVVQVFHPVLGSQPILGVVGALQLDVLVSRLKQEYGVPIRYEAAPSEAARWITSPDPDVVERFSAQHRANLAEDRDGNLVFLARNDWTLRRVMEEWPAITFATVRERGQV
ncbi:peptide chain release factor 3 [Microvirga sp. GCM10011540]|uniref:peptide chain release factor 3 n=1 Tax=Microvirga sp. GCM10011540 TaxID=3317338 RepID=UPI003606DCCB